MNKTRYPFFFDLTDDGRGFEVDIREVFLSDICLVELGLDGDWIGHITGIESLITPNATYSGLDIYEYKWNTVTGEFIISFGDLGDDEIDNIVQLSIYHPSRPDRNTAYYDEAQTAYTFTDKDLATFIGSDISRACFKIEPQFIENMRIVFGDLLTGIGE